MVGDEAGADKGYMADVWMRRQTTRSLRPAEERLDEIRGVTAGHECSASYGGEVLG